MVKPNQQFYLDLTSTLDHLRDEQALLSNTALFNLSGANAATLERFAHAWQTISADRRTRIAQALVELAEDTVQADFDAIFRYLLNDDEPSVRAQAIGGLWEDEDPALVKVLIGLLRSDPSPLVRAAAAEGLANFAYLAEVERLRPAAGVQVREALLSVIRNSEEDAQVRRRAVEAISYFGDEEIRGIIAAAHANDDPQMRASALFAMGRSADPYWKSTVLAELDSPDGEMRFEAARASGELELKPAVPRLIQLLDDPDREVQSAAIAALGQIGGAEARRALEQVSEGEDPVNAEAAVDALEELSFADETDLLLLDMDLGQDEASDLDDLDQDEEDRLN